MLRAGWLYLSLLALSACKGETTAPRASPRPGVPLETAPPNVPEAEPAFPQQTRAPGVRTRTQLDIRTVASGFEQPWAIAQLPDGKLLVTEKHAGRLRVVDQQGQKSPPVAGVPKVDGRDQGGLLDVALGPDYAAARLVYLSYYEPREGGNGLAVARGRLELGPQPSLQQVEVVFRMQPTLDSTMHAGGRLLFAQDGTLFVTLGERSIMKGRLQARDLGSHLGKIVRIRPDGSVPSDNPYAGADHKGARPEIWTSGHRNVLAGDFDSKGRLWVVEMGPRGGDELNLIERGKDYGWPTIGYGEEYSGSSIHERTQQAGLEQPVYYWDPVISPGALLIYSGELFPEWKNNFLIAGLSSKALVRLVLQNDRVVGEERLLTQLDQRIREVAQTPNGAVLLLTDGDDAQLLELTPKKPEKTP